MILDLLAIAGLTIVLTSSQLFKPAREFLTGKSLFLGKMLNCSLCTGVWVGLLVFFCGDCIKECIHYVFIGSLISEVVHLILKRLRIK